MIRGVERRPENGSDHDNRDDSVCGRWTAAYVHGVQLRLQLWEAARHERGAQKSNTSFVRADQRDPVCTGAACIKQRPERLGIRR